MTAARKPEPIFLTHGRAAFVTLTVTAGVVYTDARCPGCHRRVMAIPGVVILEVRFVRTVGERSGEGRVVGCRHCRGLVEVVEHG